MEIIVLMVFGVLALSIIILQTRRAMRSFSNSDAGGCNCGSCTNCSGSCGPNKEECREVV